MEAPALNFKFFLSPSLVGQNGMTTILFAYFNRIRRIYKAWLEYELFTVAECDTFSCAPATVTEINAP